ncbi:acyltransferase domain-containing protein [Streptomyces sp. L2]|uniref:ACP S-malonyltransferase n=1 Tax=Streptomyces sp. L2 TaxID=2162665 RepID=UPI001011B90A|nr:acyltransferase domain-containing protein [Streptomyces sp. L2]
MTGGIGRVFLFPGQGSLVGTPLSRAIARADGLAVAKEIFDEVDHYADEFAMSTAGWWDHGPLVPSSALPEGTPQLVMFATSVALHDVLSSQQVQPDALAGCSFGEIAACVVAGALSLADGVRAVCELVGVLRHYDGTGGMLLLHEGVDATQRILDTLGTTRVVVSCRNGPWQTLVSGPPSELRTVTAAAEALNIRVVRLPMVRCLSHHPEAATTAARYRERLQPLKQSPFRTPVFSPCAGRWYGDEDDLRQHIAGNLCRPVNLTAALHELAQLGASCFVECGPPGGLAQAAAVTVPLACVHSPLRASDRRQAGSGILASAGGRGCGS